MEDSYKEQFFDDFLKDMSKIMHDFSVALDSLKEGDQTALKSAKRAMHSLKGLALMMDQKDISDHSKSVEGEIKKITVSGEKLDVKALKAVDAKFAELETVVNKLLGDKVKEAPKRPKEDLGLGSRVVKVLLVEDVIGISKAIKYRLESKGFNVAQAFDGEEALNKVPTYRPDIILLDAFLPKMNGLDVCKKLKGEDEYKNIPIILISASEENKVLAQEAGAEEFILKPYETEDLIQKIKHHLGI